MLTSRQNVYRYAYLVRNIGKEGHPFSDLLPQSENLALDTSSRLFNQWSLFWDTSRPILLEKTPENFLMGDYLQNIFGRQRTQFVFIMRHPLVWALAIEKWISIEFVSLRTVEDRVAFWFECMTRATTQLPSLQDAVVLQLEAISGSTTMQQDTSRQLLCRTLRHLGEQNQQATADAPAAPTRPITSNAILSSSLAYVTCWLTGLEFKASLRRCTQRKAFHDPAYRSHSELLAVENIWRLNRMGRHNELHANTFGYSFTPFLNMAKRSIDTMRRTRIDVGDPAASAAQLGVHIQPILVATHLRPHLSVTSPEPHTHDIDKNATSYSSSVLLVYHKLGFDSDKPTGMDIRMGQIMESLIDLRVQVHFLCHCHVETSQLSPFSGDVVVYFGSLKQQYEEATHATPFRFAFIFFTTLTMSVHQRMTSGDNEWHLEPKYQLPEEQVLAWLHRDYPDNRADKQSCFKVHRKGSTQLF